MSTTHAEAGTDGSPAERRSTPVDGVDVLGALSPSRASDFMTCPLLYRYRTIDKLPEEPSVDALRGTVVHKVLEDLFDLPAPSRTPDRARALLPPPPTGLAYWTSFRSAHNAAWVRSTTPMRLNVEVRWALTVRSEIPR